MKKRGRAASRATRKKPKGVSASRRQGTKVKRKHHKKPSPKVLKTLVDLEKDLVKKSEKHTIPTGIRVLTYYFSAIGLLYLFFLLLSINAPVALFFGKIIKGPWAMTNNLVALLVLAFVIYGFIQRKRISYYVANAWLCYGIINSIISLLFLEGTNITDLNNLIVLTSYSILLINGMIIWYLTMEHHYFFDMHYHRKEYGKEDKIFITLITLLWLLCIVGALLVGIRFFNQTTVMTDKIVEEFNDQYSWRIKSICDNKEANEQDLCYVIYGAIQVEEGEEDITPTCNKIDSDIYRFTCMRMNT